MKKLLFLLIILSVSFSLFAESSSDSSAVGRFYKQSTLELPGSGVSKDVAQIPVSYDLSSVKTSYVQMGFSSTDPDVALTDLGPSIALHGDAESGTITGFESDVYAYCRIISSVPIVVSITGLSPLVIDDMTAISGNEDAGIIDWQVYSGSGADKKVYFNGLQGRYIVPAVSFLNHRPQADGQAVRIASAKLSIESESFRGKAIGSYSSELIMTITSVN